MFSVFSIEDIRTFLECCGSLYVLVLSKEKKEIYEKLVEMFFFARLPLIFRSSSSMALSYTSERKHGLSYFDTLSSFSYTSERTFDSFYVVCTHPCFCLECSDCSIWSRLHFAFSQMSPSIPRRSPPDFPLLPSAQDFVGFRQRPGRYEKT